MRQWMCLLAIFALGGCNVLPSRKKPKPPVQVQVQTTSAGEALERLTSDSSAERGAAISPDGKTLLFWSDSGKSSRIVGIDPSNRRRRTIYTSSANRSRDPVWLPNGAFFVFASNSAGAMSLVRALSKKPNAAVRVIVGGDVAPQPGGASFSPDGKTLCLHTRIRKVWKIGIVSLGRPGFTLLGPGKSPAWSPKGDRIAFHKKVGKNHHIFTIDAKSGGDLVQVTTGATKNKNPAWSPDGKFLVFQSNRGWESTTGGDRKLTTNLFIVSPDGTELAQLTDGNGTNEGPAWGRDGWIYFSSNQEGNPDIWRLRPTGEYALGKARKALEPAAKRAPLPPPPAETQVQDVRFSYRSGQRTGRLSISIKNESRNRAENVVVATESPTAEFSNIMLSFGSIKPGRTVTRSGRIRVPGSQKQVVVGIVVARKGGAPALQRRTLVLAPESRTHKRKRTPTERKGAAKGGARHSDANDKDRICSGSISRAVYDKKKARLTRLRAKDLITEAQLSDYKRQLARCLSQ